MTLDPRLHGYQRRAISHLHETGEVGAGLFLDMGLFPFHDKMVS